MSDDLVERLRELAGVRPRLGYSPDLQLVSDAADEIARLRAQFASARKDAIEECLQIVREQGWCGGGAVVCSDAIEKRMSALTDEKGNL